MARKRHRFVAASGTKIYRAAGLNSTSIVPTTLALPTQKPLSLEAPRWADRVTGSPDPPIDVGHPSVVPRLPHFVAFG